MAKKDYAVPIEIQSAIGARVQAFNRKYLAKSESKYLVQIRGKFIYLMYHNVDGSFDNVCRLIYSGDVEDMDFAIFKYSSEKYDPDEFSFSGRNHVNGTIEGAMKAGLKAYPI